MIGYGNTINPKFMEAYIGASVSTNATVSPLGMNSVMDPTGMNNMMGPTPNNWLNWGKVMPIDTADTNASKSEGAGITGGLDVYGGVNGMGGLGGSFNAVAWTNWLGKVPSDKKVTEPQPKGAATSLF